MSSFKLIKLKKQTTLKSSFCLTGQSMIKNRKVFVECLPAKANTGIVFIIKNQTVKVNYKNYLPTKLHTTILAKEKIRVKTVEHILSAFYGLGIDNVIINLQGDNQLPLLDGSSKLYAKNILNVGIKRLPQDKAVIKVMTPYVIHAQNNGLAIFLPHSKLVIQSIINFNNLISVQEQELICETNKYYQQISAARTFFIKHYDRKRWQVLQNKFRLLADDPKKSQVIVYNQKDYITKLRYYNEPVRHKILDMLGDFALLGHQLVGKVIVYRPGHSFTLQIIKQILNSLT